MVSVLLKDRDLLFLHIPKTAGGTVSRLLRDQPDAVLYSVQDMSKAEPCVVQLGRQLDKPLHEYKTVAFVRNLWDWTVSGYLHVTQNMPAYDHPPTFRDFVLGDWGHPTILQYPKKFTTANAYVEYHTQITPWQHLFGPERNVKIDRLCTFEALADDVRDVFGTTNELPHANKSERRHYSEYYDEETQFITAERHQELIEAFGYRFARP